MENWIRLVGDDRTLELFGVTLFGVSAATGGKLLITLLFVAVVQVLQRAAKAVMDFALARMRSRRVAFWAHEGRQLVVAVVLVIGIVSIWFENPARSATMLGLATAGLAFALQRVILAVAAYFIILRGETFHVGDRIKMGGVRGDVIAVTLTQTTIMEMGQPPPVQGEDPGMWVQSRQYTGRVVTVSNARLFDEPVYNYSREFPYIWEELTLPISYSADRATAERVLLEVAQRHTADLSGVAAETLRKMERRYQMRAAEMKPRVYMRMTDNWLELTVRFVVADHDMRDVKDRITRDVLAALEQNKIGIASATFEIVGLPPLRLAPAEGKT